jgi:hypothetical protein
MPTLEISPNFTVDDIHNLRVQIGEKYRVMSQDEIDRDIAEHVANAKRTVQQKSKPDYTEWQRTLFQRMSLDELLTAADNFRKKMNTTETLVTN